jgi:hypothetical protein
MIEASLKKPWVHILSKLIDLLPLTHESSGSECFLREAFLRTCGPCLTFTESNPLVDVVAPGSAATPVQNQNQFRNVRRQKSDTSSISNHQHQQKQRNQQQSQHQKQRVEEHLKAKQ